MTSPAADEARNNEVNRFIVDERERFVNMSFAQFTIVVNEKFGTNLTRNAVIARYNRYGGKKYLRKPGGSGLRVAKRLKIPRPRDGIDNAAPEPKQEIPTFSRIRNHGPVNYHNRDAIVADAAAQIDKIEKSELFTLGEKETFKTIQELNSRSCRWPL